MILTTCAACAAPLAHTAPRCIRCQTRYCNEAAGRGHPGFGREGSPERQRRLDQRRAPSTPEGQRIINTSGLPRMVDPETSAANAWLAHLAGRGLPPDWTYRDLEGHH